MFYQKIRLKKATHYFKIFNKHVFFSNKQNTHAVLHCQIPPKAENEGIWNNKLNKKIYHERKWYPITKI